MADLILHPFRILVSGGVATADQNSDAYIASQLGVIAGTRIGERDMCEPFGVQDATYGALAPADIQTCLDVFGPDGVTVTSVVTTADTAEISASVVITWDRDNQ